MTNPKENSLKVIGASVVGPLHLKTCTPCQDAYAYEIFKSETGVIAVADGLGSAEFSDLGSIHAVEAAITAVREMLYVLTDSELYIEDITKKAVYLARHALESKAEEHQCKLRDLACTLIVVVIHKDNVVVAHIGDGAVVTKSEDGLKLVSGPGESEYTNEVVPLTDKEWDKFLRITSKNSGILGVMAFTDGCQRAALRKTPEGLVPFEGFCEPLFSYAKEVNDIKEAEEDIKNLLLSKKLCENSEDDKTLVIATIK